MPKYTAMALNHSLGFKFCWFFFLLVLITLGEKVEVVSQNLGGILFPQDSETRERKSLDGIWNFRISPRNDPDLGFRQEWYSRPLSQVMNLPIIEIY